nr:protein NRT1/ PTR FAMILY 5.10-like [Coffea arabica]
MVHVYYKGSPGGWRSASFMVAGGSLERFAYYGVKSNLISYLTGPLGEPVATAAANVNTWIGVVSLVPVLGAYLADSFLSRYRSIIIASILYILGLGFLSLSASSSPTFLSSSSYQAITKKSGLDTRNQEKSKAKSSFVNWWLYGLCIGSIAAHLILHYIQDNISWTIGFGILRLVMILWLILFLLGHRTYFFDVKRGDEESPYGRIKWGIAKEGDALSSRAQASSSQEECQEYLLSKTQQRSQDYR